MSVLRITRALALAAWAAFFWWLALSGEMTRYLGPRTYWVAWFGAIVLSAAALAHLLTARAGDPRRPSGRELGGFLLLLAPVLIVFAVPQPELGALAAARRTAGVGTVASSIPRPPANPGEIGFSEIYYASQSFEYAQAVGIVDGTGVDLTGFVTHPKKGPEGTFSLTRFYVSCCAADAVPYSVVVLSKGDFPDDTWLRIEGTLGDTSDDGFVIDPEDVVEVDEPKNPYLY
jgi:putative membrane protein